MHMGQPCEYDSRGKMDRNWMKASSTVSSMRMGFNNAWNFLNEMKRL